MALVADDPFSAVDHHICRFCLKRGPDMVQIPGPDFQLSNVHRLYTDITKIELPVNPDLPELVCSTCTTGLEFLYEEIRRFQETALFWQEFLQKRMCKDIVVKQEFDDTALDLVEVNQDFGNTALDLVEVKQEFDDTELYLVETKPDDPTEKCFTQSNTFEDKADQSIHIKSPIEITLSKVHLDPLALPPIIAKPHGVRLTAKTPRNKHIFSSVRNRGISFECVYCHAKFRELHQFDRHNLPSTATPSNKYPLPCPVCKLKFYNEHCVRHHLDEVHLAKQPKVCPCGTSFHTFLVYYMHMKRTHSIICCHLCSKQFPTLGRFKFHIKQHCPEEDRTCNECAKVFRTQISLHEHTRMVHIDKKAVCAYCGLVFRNQKCLYRHNRRMHNPKRQPQPCEHCKQSFKTTYDLTRHQKLRHDESMPYKCEDCNWTYAHLIGLQRHISMKKCCKIITGENPILS